MNLMYVPDVRQPNNYSCGAAAAMGIGLRYKVGWATIGQWEKALGTTLEYSTPPEKIVEVLQKLGLVVEYRQITVSNLISCWYSEKPVIIPLQDYGHKRNKGAKIMYGHYLTYIGGPWSGYLFFQDSTEDNLIEDSIQAPGKVMIEEATFLKNWHDWGKRHMGIIAWK